jgi:hypothetical protein
MKMKFRSLIAVAAVFAASSFLASTARAGSFNPVNFSVWANALPNNGSLTQSNLPTGTSTAAGFIFNLSAGPLNFYTNTDTSLTKFLLTAYNPLTNSAGGWNGDVPQYTKYSLSQDCLPPAMGCGINNDVMNFTGHTYLQNGATYSITHDDGILLYVDGTQINLPNSGAPTSAATSSFMWTGTSGWDNFSLWYAETNGAPGVLYAPDLAVTPEPSSLLLLGTGLFAMAFLLFRRKSEEAVSHATLSA